MPDAPLDLDLCAAEPIRIPGGIQPHGALVVCAPEDGRILQASVNLGEIVGADLALGQPIGAAAGLGDLWRDLQLMNPGDAPILRPISLVDRRLLVTAHRTDQGLIVELEPGAAGATAPPETLYPLLRRAMEALASAPTVLEMARAAVRDLRAITGFNRLLLYSFDAAGDGSVIAEDRDEALPSYLGLRFPASDIPSQARDLYRLSRLRLIPTADYVPVPVAPPLSPVDGNPLDLGRAALRSVSPVHLEYMRNMGTIASMSVSIVVEGELWGLISAHHAGPRTLDPEVRAACDHLGRVLSLQVEAREQASRTAERLRLATVQSQLLAGLADAPDYAERLASRPDDWMAVAGGAGTALVSEGRVITAGLAPEPDQVLDLANRLSAQGAREFASESLAETWPDLAGLAETTSGLLAVSVSQIHPNYLMWFRPEVVRTVEWAGEPAKPFEKGDHLHPRKSFELWKEQVRRRSAPWSDVEIESARHFRASVQAFVLRRAEERAELTSRLAEINAELESFSYSISHDLRAPFRHVVGFSDLLAEHAAERLDETERRYLTAIREAGLSAGRLVDDLLTFSQLGRNALTPTRIDMDRLVTEVRRSLAAPGDPDRVSWDIGPLPEGWGDRAMIRQVLLNLVGNALKYSAPVDAPQITIKGERREGKSVYTIADNGVGFDMAYVHKLFSVFQRLHRVEEFEGAGIGLALVRRIVDRHGGEVWAKGAAGRGAEFGFSLPSRPTLPKHGDI